MSFDAVHGTCATQPQHTYVCLPASHAAGRTSCGPSSWRSPCFTLYYHTYTSRRHLRRPAKPQNNKPRTLARGHHSIFRYHIAAGSYPRLTPASDVWTPHAIESKSLRFRYFESHAQPRTKSPPLGSRSLGPCIGMESCVRSMTFLYLCGNSQPGCWTLQHTQRFQPVKQTFRIL